MRALALVGAWLAGCAPGSEHDRAGRRDRPAEDDLAEVEALLQLAADEVFLVDARAVERSYVAAMADGDGACPSAYDGFWYDTCDAASGASFDGYVIELEDDGSAGYGVYWLLYAEATIGRAEGPALHLSGQTGWGELDDGAARHVYHYAYGTFHDPASEGWLARAMSTSMYAQVSTLDEGGDRAVYVEGELGALGGVPGQAIDWDGVYLAEAGWPDTACPGAPVGEAHVRTADGRWFGLAFETCDGCATVSDDAGERGTVCADFSGWLAWEVSPW